MKKEKRSKLKYYIYAIIPVLSFISVGFLATYSFYLASVVGNEETEELVLKTAQVTAMFEARDSISASSIFPGFSDSLEFSIYNTTPEENIYGNYTLSWEIITNDIDDNSFTYTLEGKAYRDGELLEEDEKNKLVSVKTPTRIPTASSTIGEGTINSFVEHRYKLSIHFKETGNDQNDLQGKRFDGKISAKELNK